MIYTLLVPYQIKNTQILKSALGINFSICNLIILNNSVTTREKGISTRRINQYWIFHHTLIETYFEMLKSSEHEILGRSSNYKSPIFQDCSEVRSADSQMSFYY